MVYQTTKPAPNDDLDVSVTDIQQNFLTANTIMDINHYPFDNVTASKGKHKFVSFVAQTPPATLSGELALYSKSVPGDGVCLFLTRDNSTSFDVQLTTDKIQQPIGATNGYTFLPGGPVGGGLIMQWGIVNSNTQNTNTAQAFNVAFPNTCFNVQTTLLATAADPTNAGTVMIKSVSTGSFTWRFVTGSGSYSSFYWVAIGN